MPQFLPDLTPPKPPVLMPSQRPDPNLSVMLRYQQMQIVWLQQQFNIVRNVVNWLVGQQNIVNLVPDSDIKDPATFWMVALGWVVTDAVGVGGGRGFVLTGSPVTASVVGTAFTVVPATMVVLSGWIDARALVGGTVGWALLDNTNAVIEQVNQTLGDFDRVEILVTIPPGVTSAKVALIATAAQVTSQVIASQPQVELPIAGHGITMPTATLYRSNSGDGSGVGPPIVLSKLMPWTDLVGTKDSVNTIFTLPFDLALSAGVPIMAWILWNGAPLAWTIANPPPVGFWTLLTGPQRIIVGQGPLPGDELAIPTALAA